MNHYYFYGVDRDFGPFFLKFCSYFPYNGRLCLNGHEYAKQPLKRKKIAYDALDNGVQSCRDSGKLQEICDGLTAEKIDIFCRKWLRRRTVFGRFDFDFPEFGFGCSTLAASFAAHLVGKPNINRRC